MQPPRGVAVDNYDHPARMLLEVGANPPAAIIIDTRARGLKVTSIVRALTAGCPAPVYVGVWDDEHSKRLAYRCLGRGARGLVSMPTTSTTLAAIAAEHGARVEEEPRLQVGRLVLVQESRETLLGPDRVHLAEAEFGLLRCLAQAYPRPVGINELTQGCTTCGPYRSPGVRKTVSRLRRHLEAVQPGAGALIETIRGIGYVLRDTV